MAYDHKTPPLPPDFCDNMIVYPGEMTCREMREQEDAAERLLAALRDSFPEWRIIETAGGGLTAVPAGTQVVPAYNADDMTQKLRMLHNYVP